MARADPWHPWLRQDDRPLKIVFVGNFGLWRKGTMGSRALPMARELIAAGHEAVLVVPPWDAPEEADSAVCAWGVPVRNVPIRTGLVRHPSATFELLRATLAERPDVVVAVKPKAYAGLLTLLFGAMGPRGRRPVRLVVDADDWEAGWSALGGDPAPVRALVGWQERAALRRADHVLVASRELARLVADTDIPSERITYMPNATWAGAAGWSRARRPRSDSWTPPDTFSRVDPLDGPVVLLYSRLFEFRLDRFLDVLQRVVATVPTVRLLVVGAGLRGEERQLRAALAGRGLLDRTTLVGWAKREDLPDLLALGDVALVPMDDTLVNRARCSVKLLDLMLSGRATVADAVGQAREYLRDGETGRLIGPEDAPAMAEAAIQLLKRPSTARRLGRAAERAARRDFTWTAQREALLQAVVGR